MVIVLSFNVALRFKRSCRLAAQLGQQRTSFCHTSFAEPKSKLNERGFEIEIKAEQQIKRHTVTVKNVAGPAGKLVTYVKLQLLSYRHGDTTLKLQTPQTDGIFKLICDQKRMFLL